MKRRPSDYIIIIFVIMFFAVAAFYILVPSGQDGISLIVQNTVRRYFFNNLWAWIFAFFILGGIILVSILFY